MSSWSDTIKGILPPPLRRWLRRFFLNTQLHAACIRDARRYATHSSTLNWANLNKEMLEARIAATYHVLEKGLSFEDTRLGFGQGMIRNLIGYLKEHRSKYGEGEVAAVRCALSTLNAYIQFHEKHDFDVSAIKQEVQALSVKTRVGGTIRIRRQDLLASGQGDFAAVCTTRRSVRQFTSEPVNLDLLKEALELAQFAPSVCNRQTSRVHVVCNRSQIDKLLTLQGGTRGFSHRVPMAVVITSNLHSFEGIGERNQSFVDGGMYAMNLLYALHYKGLGGCPLIWCQPPDVEHRIRELVGIPDYERLIMLIAVGNVPDEFEVAEAKRFSIDQIYHILKEDN